MKVIKDISLGDNLQKLRKQKGLTQRQLCAEMKLAGRPMLQSTYAQIETGARNIYISDLILIARLLEVDMNHIFEGLKPINKYEQETENE